MKQRITLNKDELIMFYTILLLPLILGVLSYFALLDEYKTIQNGLIIGCIAGAISFICGLLFIGINGKCKKG